nr:cytochrome P450 [Variibacter gotjawalensis]
MSKESDELKAAALAFDVKALPKGFIDDPFPLYHALRTHDPVHRMPDGSLFLTRHQDLENVYKDTTTFSSDKKIEFGAKYGATPLFDHHTTSLVFNDPPLHTRVRKILAGALNPRAVSALEPAVETLVGRLLDAMEEKGDVDLIEDFACAIPVEVIGNLLDVPHDERGPLRDWSLAILGALEPVLTPEQTERGNRAVREFLAYLETLVARRREKPGDPEHDVLTRLIRGEQDGSKLSEAELLQNCIFILNAGHETTTNLIGNALWLFEQWPDQRARIIADPSLARLAVEEALRIESSNQLGNRLTTADTEIGGVPVSRGSFVTLCIGAANRDPAVFAEPDRFDIGRQPNRHLGYASGPHVCVGMSVARLEGRIAVSRFLARFPNYRLTGNAVRSQRIRFRGFQSLPARVA